MEDPDDRGKYVLLYGGGRFKKKTVKDKKEETFVDMCKYDSDF